MCLSNRDYNKIYFTACLAGSFLAGKQFKQLYSSTLKSFDFSEKLEANVEIITKEIADKIKGITSTDKFKCQYYIMSAYQKVMEINDIPVTNADPVIRKMIHTSTLLLDDVVIENSPYWAEVVTNEDRLSISSSFRSIAEQVIEDNSNIVKMLDIMVKDSSISYISENCSNVELINYLRHHKEQGKEIIEYIDSLAKQDNVKLILFNAGNLHDSNSDLSAIFKNVNVFTARAHTFNINKFWSSSMSNNMIIDLYNEGGIEELFKELQSSGNTDADISYVFGNAFIVDLDSPCGVVRSIYKCDSECNVYNLYNCSDSYDEFSDKIDKYMKYQLDAEFNACDVAR